VVADLPDQDRVLRLGGDRDGEDDACDRRQEEGCAHAPIIGACETPPQLFF